MASTPNDGNASEKPSPVRAAAATATSADVASHIPSWPAAATAADAIATRAPPRRSGRLPKTSLASTYAAPNALIARAACDQARSVK